MLTLKPAKSFGGKFNLPPSPDLFLLSAVSSIAAGRVAVVSPVTRTPLTDQWSGSLKNLASFEFESDRCKITPLTGDKSSDFLLLPFEQLPYRDLIVFTLLGMGKTVAFRAVSPKRIEAWVKHARKLGFTLQASAFDENLSISLKEKPDQLSESLAIEQEDVSPLLGLHLGSGCNCSFQIDFQYASPLRLLAPQLGFEVSVKSNIAKETDPIARRMRMMAKKKRTSSGQQFTVKGVFTKSDTDGTPVEIMLPGDEVLGAILTVAKCLFSKGSLVLGNIPLETWATPVFSFVRKMGGKISVQETHRSSFGSTGIISIQKCDLTGRKVECCPAVDFIPYLPSLTVLAAFAQGQSVFRDLEDLRNDEPDGIDVIESCIRTLGARLGEMPDGIVMEGKRVFDGFDLSISLPPHIAGCYAIAGLKCIGETTINDELLEQRWPDFQGLLSQLFEFRS